MTRKQKERARFKEENERWRSCTRKQKYATELEALGAAKWSNHYNRCEIGFTAYSCKHCGKFHLSSN